MFCASSARWAVLVVLWRRTVGAGGDFRKLLGRLAGGAFEHWNFPRWRQFLRYITYSPSLWSEKESPLASREDALTDSLALIIDALSGTLNVSRQCAEIADAVGEPLFRHNGTPRILWILRCALVRPVDHGSPDVEQSCREPLVRPEIFPDSNDARPFGYR